MSTHESTRLAEFSLAVRESSLSRLRKVDSGRINWAPHETAMSFADIAHHLIAADNWLFRKLKERDIEPIMGSAGEAGVLSIEDFEKMLAELQETGTKRAELIGTMTSEQFDELVYDARFGGEVSVWWVIVRGNLDHEIHHRGQLAAYLRVAAVV